MTPIFALLVLPLALAVAAVVLFLKGRRNGLVAGVAFFALSAAIGFWAITQSRSSTAAIGFPFLPSAAAAAGALAWAFRNLQVSERHTLRVAGWACLALALALLGYQAVGGVESIQRNAARDAAQRVQASDIENNRKGIAAALAQNPGRESATLDRLIEQHGADRAFLIPALESRWASAATLDRMANSTDLGVVLQAVRNPNCAAATLTRVYRTHVYPDYFFQALADNANTPVEILRELYARPGARESLGIWLARNRATPRDLLEDLAATADAGRIQSLLRNPNLDCVLVGKIETALKRSERPGDAYSVSRLAELRKALCG